MACGDGTALELIEVQVEGRKRMSAAAFLNGHHLKDDEILGGKGRVKLPLGYRYGAVYAGIRKVKKDDLALIVPDVPASGAAVFTQNRVQAAPVRIARWNLTKSRGQVSAVLVNAGNANCATRTGDRVALACCDAVANQLHVPPTQVFPASTGVIGVELDAHLIVNALPGLIAGLAADRFEDAARAILTTDLVMKTAHQQGTLEERHHPDRRDDQGLRNDPSEHGHHARIRDDGRGRSAFRAFYHARRRGEAQLQPHQRGRRYVHQRYDAGAGRTEHRAYSPIRKKARKWKRR